MTLPVNLIASLFTWIFDNIFPIRIKGKQKPSGIDAGNVTVDVTVNVPAGAEANVQVEIRPRPGHYARRKAKPKFVK